MGYRRVSIVSAVVLATMICAAGKTYELTSPSARICVAIECGDSLSYSVKYDGRTVVAPSPVSVTLADGTFWGRSDRLLECRRCSVDTVVDTPFAQSAQMADRHNALTLTVAEEWKIEFRAYDDGVAYRFVCDNDAPADILSEQVEINFPDDYIATVPYVRTGTDGDFRSQFFNSFENSLYHRPALQAKSRPTCISSYTYRYRQRCESHHNGDRSQ